MSKRLIYALVLIGLVVIVLLMNRGKVQVDLIFTTVSGIKSLVLLAFTAIGVVIGVLLK